MYEPVQSRLLLTMCGISHRHAFLAPFGLHGRNVKDEIGILDSVSRFRGAFGHTILSERVANPTNVEMTLGNLNFSAHGMFAIIFTIWIGVISLEDREKGVDKMGKHSAKF